MMNAIALPLAPPARSVTSLTSVRSCEVRCAAPADPLVHAGGLQLAEADVRGRIPTLPGAVEKVGVLSAATARIRTEVATDFEVPDVNWMAASVIVAPRGTSTPANRRPMTCCLVPALGMLSEVPSQST